jgi:hypothetical protein
MAEDGNGDGHSVMLPECKQMFKELKCDSQDIRRALWGGEGTTGIVKDINDMKVQNRLLTYIGVTIVGIGASVVTSLIILLVTGKL